jgi:hypothetical protein
MYVKTARTGQWPQWHKGVSVTMEGSRASRAVDYMGQSKLQGSVSACQVVSVSLHGSAVVLRENLQSSIGSLHGLAPMWASGAPYELPGSRWTSVAPEGDCWISFRIPGLWGKFQLPSIAFDPLGEPRALQYEAVFACFFHFVNFKAPWPRSMRIRIRNIDNSYWVGTMFCNPSFESSMSPAYSGLLWSSVTILLRGLFSTGTSVGKDKEF